MISLKPQRRVPMDPSETFYFLGTWSDEPMSKKKWGESPHETVQRNARKLGLTHKMTTGMTVKGTSTGRFTKHAPKPHYYPRFDGTKVVDFSTPSDSIKAEDLAVDWSKPMDEIKEDLAGLPSGIRGTRPKLAIWDNIPKGIADSLFVNKGNMTYEEFEKQYGQEFSDILIEQRKSLSETMMEQAAKSGLAVMEIRCTPVHPEDFYGFPMTEEEMMEGPLPEWAIGRAKGEYARGAQLPTRDGRRCGNAHILEISHDLITNEPLFFIMTDAGSTMLMNAQEVREQFYPPVWVSDVEDVKRKFGRNE